MLELKNYMEKTMRTLFISLMLTGFFFSPIAQADLAPEPENSEPADEDTAESEDTEKSGCSSEERSRARIYIMQH